MEKQVKQIRNDQLYKEGIKDIRRLLVKKLGINGLRKLLERAMKSHVSIANRKINQ
jgi:hypothetical protein